MSRTLGNATLASRIRDEAQYLAAVYSQPVEFGYDPAIDRWWVMIEDFPLPKGWRQPSTPILVTVTQAYPMAPPDGFMLSTGLCDDRGNSPGHYYGLHASRDSTGALRNAGWGWFCLHPTGWSGDYDYRDGDSIAKYLNLIEIALAKVVR